MTNPVADVLNKAADLIDERGWFQKSPDATSLCALKAIQHASSAGPARFQARAAFVRHVGAQVGPMGSPSVAIIDWNDEPGRTQAEVTAALRETAKVVAHV